LNSVAKISEIFYSISGEGQTQGFPTIFVRISGCSLRCGLTSEEKLWCDTPYALSHQAGQSQTIEEILSKIESFPNLGIGPWILTGGEPLEANNRFLSIELSKIYRERFKTEQFPYARLETNGKESIQGLEDMVFTMDYKLPHSGMEKFMNWENLEILKNRNQPLDELKFIIRNRRDFDRSLEVLSISNYKGTSLFSPVYHELSMNILASWLLEEYPLGRLSLPYHKIIWGEKRGV
jgi:7-carboxy-7-deazaguanine synthase